MINQSTEVAVRLGKAHTHAGTLYQAGATIFVMPPVADWLEKNKVGSIERNKKSKEKQK